MVTKQTGKLVEKARIQDTKCLHTFGVSEMH